MNYIQESSYPTPLRNSTLLPLLLLSLATQKHSPEPSTTFKGEYDFIVVGSGTAGSVVASRLSELACATVLLIEAGKAPPLLTEVPAFARYFPKTDVDWNFMTEPQKCTGKGHVDRKFAWTNGKMLGGSGNIDSMLYVRGNKRNFDSWAKNGAKGWRYIDVYRYFLKLEDNTDPKFLLNGYHASGGPITVMRPRYWSKVKRAIQEAALSLGYWILDSNAERQTGFYDHQSNLRNSQRCSSLKAYMVPASKRKNIDILVDTVVTKVLIEHGQAVGVQCDTGGRIYNIRARKEVIVSGGVVNTPQILMLSGVGPKEELQKFKIPVLADLPVGKNFHNHGGTKVFFTLDPDVEAFDKKLANPDNIMEYINSRTGPLASSDGTIGMAFLSGLTINPPMDFPNSEIYITEMPLSSIKGSGLKPEVYDRLIKPYENKTIFACSTQQNQPRSRGMVTIRSTNPHDPPVIDPNYLADPRDRNDIVEGLLACKRFINTCAFRKLGAQLFETLVPGCEKFANNDYAYFSCLTGYVFFPHHHGVGTCKMGNPRDPTTVLDPQLKVKNIRGLRVVDGSIMPEVTSGNTGIPIVMIAEKAADMIKQDFCCGSRIHCKRFWC